MSCGSRVGIAEQPSPGARGAFCRRTTWAQNSPPTTAPAPGAGGRVRVGMGGWPAGGKRGVGVRGCSPPGAPARGTSWSAPQPPPAPLAPSPAPQLWRLYVRALRERARTPLLPSAQGPCPGQPRPHPEPVHSASVAARLPPFPGGCGAGARGEAAAGTRGGHPGARADPAQVLSGLGDPRWVPRAQPAALQSPGGGSRRGQRQAWEGPRRGRGAGVRGAVPL